MEIENAIGNVSWLLRVSKSLSSAAADDDGYLGLPPIATNEPILCLIWEQIAKLLRGSPEDKADAAASLVSLTQSNDLSGRLIIKKGGVGPLLKLVKEGEMDAQESAAQALGLLARDQESVEVMVQAGACSVFTKVLKEGSMKVQATVAWAVSELATHYPQCQDIFAQQNAVQLLAECLLINYNGDDHMALRKLKDHNRAMAARALGALAKGNSRICRSITDSSWLMGLFPLLLEKSSDEFKQNTSGLLWKLTVNLYGAPRRLIYREGGAGPLLKLLKQGPMQVQTTVAWAVWKLAKDYPERQDTFAQQNAVQLLVECLLNDSNCCTNTDNVDTNKSVDQPLLGRGDYPINLLKDHKRAMAARALSALAQGNSRVCRSITDSGLMNHFPLLLEESPVEIQESYAGLLMEMTYMAELGDEDMRSYFFNPHSPGVAAIIKQLLRIVRMSKYKLHDPLLMSCITTLGCLGDVLGS